MWKTFAIIELTINGISIWHNTIDHWVKFYTDAVLGLFQLLGFVLSWFIPSETEHWKFFIDGAKLMSSAFLIQIIAIGVTVFIAVLIDRSS